MKTSIKSLVHHFGLTHQQIADFLGIDRSIVSRVISGEKPLPDKAAQPLQWINTGLQQFKQPGRLQRSSRSINLQQRSQLLQEKIVACRLQLKQTEQRMQQLQQQQLHCDNTHVLVSILMEHKDLLTTERQRRWLAERQYQAKQQAAACNSEQLWLMGLELKTLAHQRAFYEQQLIVIKNQINKS